LQERLEKSQAPTPPPDSWAADAAHEVAVWNIKMEAGATFTFQKHLAGINRTIYFYEGKDINGSWHYHYSLPCY
jgi:redox-sensitive bicupin YhaK (pirin superfamily)